MNGPIYGLHCSSPNAEWAYSGDEWYVAGVSYHLSTGLSTTKGGGVDNFQSYPQVVHSFHRLIHRFPQVIHSLWITSLWITTYPQSLWITLPFTLWITRITLWIVDNLWITLSTELSTGDKPVEINTVITLRRHFLWISLWITTDLSPIAQDRRGITFRYVVPEWGLKRSEGRTAAACAIVNVEPSERSGLCQRLHNELSTGHLGLGLPVRALGRVDGVGR